MPLEAEDYIAILTAEDEELPAVVGEIREAGPPVPALGDEDWQEDPVPTKLEKIRGVFLNARTASEVRAAAATMPIGDWLDHVTKMTKQVEAGPVQITAIRIELPPRDAYCGKDAVVEVELPQ